MLEQTQLQYNGMFKSVFELLQAKRKQIVAAEEFIDTLEDYWLARTKLELAVGGQFKNVPMTVREKFQPSEATPIITGNSAPTHHHGD